MSETTTKEEPRAFLTVYPDDHFELCGGLVFHPGLFVVIMEHKGRQHSMEDIRFIGAHPKWWQLKQWWGIIQDIRRVVPAVKGPKCDNWLCRFVQWIREPDRPSLAWNLEVPRWKSVLIDYGRLATFGIWKPKSKHKPLP